MDNGQDNGQEPGHRRRLDKERQNTRDGEIWRRHQRGYSLAEIAFEFGMPRSTVQASVDRTKKRLAQQLRADAETMGAPQHLLAMLDNPDIDDPTTIRSVGDCERLSPLGAHRIMYLPDDHPARAVVNQWTPSREWTARTYPPEDDAVGDYGGGSWRDGVAKARGEYIDAADD